MPTLSPCPNRERLQALKRGDLEGDSLELICQHLSDCCDCDQALAALEDADDEIVGNLRQFLNHEPLIKREECKRLEERAQAIPIGHLELFACDADVNLDAPTTPREFEIPKRLGKYQLGRKLGRGGMGVVFAATHMNLHREVAIKVIVPECAQDPRMLARFRREVKAVGKLKHENIVTATDAGDDQGHHFLVMELVDGLDLDALLKANGPLPVADACEIIRQAALGLQYVHEQGGVHRDLKPSNLMLAADGTVKILDLGLARVFSDRGTSAGLTRSSQVMGTEDYMAPEQWDDSGKVDIRADIYSLGCTLYKILTGDALYCGAEYKPLPKKKAAHRQLEPPSIRSRRPEVSAALANVLKRSLEKDREARFSTPLDFADALAPFGANNDCKLLIANGKQVAAGIVPAAAVTPGTRPETVDSPRHVATRGQSSARRFIAVMGRRRWPIVVGAFFFAAAAVVRVIILSWGPWAKEADRHQDNRDNSPRVQKQTAGWAGNRPLEPGEKVELLTDKPFELLWNSIDDNLYFDRTKKETTALATKVALLRLGRAEYASYRLQIDLKQTRWTGGAGVFFGYRETTEEGHRCIKYQFLEVTPHNQGGFTLRRYSERYFPNRKDVSGGETGNGSAEIGTLINSEVSTLVVEVRAKGLQRVTWNGTALSKLVAPERNHHLEELDYVGDFGIYCRRSTTVFSNAFITLFARSSQ